MAVASVGSLDQFRISNPVQQGLSRFQVAEAAESPMFVSKVTSNSVFPNGFKNVRTFSVSIDFMTGLEARSLEALLATSQGGALPVDLTVQGFDQAGIAVDETIQVRITSQTVSFRAQTGGRFSAALDVEELPHVP